MDRKGLVLHRVNERDPSVAAKAENKAGGGKENSRGKLVVSQKSSGRDINARDIVRGQTGKKQSTSREGDKKGLAGSKVKIG